MKTSEKPIHLSYLRYGFLALLLMAFSCNPDTVLESDNLESADARSKNKNDSKSANAVLKTLAKGSVPGMSNGIDVGPDGFLYAGSVVEQTINVINKNNGRIVDRISNMVTGPDDLVFGPEDSDFKGYLYWTDLLTGEVGLLKPDGSSPVKQLFAGGVNPIAFNDENRMFVALDFQGDGLYEFDPELVNDPRPIIECPSFLETGIPCLGFFNSFDFGPDGRLYGPLFAFNLIIAVDVGGPNDPPLTGSLQDGFGPNDEFGVNVEILAGAPGLPGTFLNPAATKFGPDGLLYILDQSGSLFTLDIDTRELTTITTSLDPGLDNMVFDEDGSLYMTNNDEGWVAEILLPSGQARILSPGGMIAPQGLAVFAGPNNQDIVFEADLFSMREFNGTSGRQTGIYKGSIAPVPGVLSLTLPQNVSASGTDLIISSFFSSNVQIWNPKDGVIREFADQVFAPLDAVRLNSGDVIVSDIARLGPGRGGGVFRMDDPNTIFEFPGVASGLATDGEKVWAADWAAGIIFEIDFKSEPPAISPAVLDVNFPEGIAVDNEGRLLVYESMDQAPGGPSRLTRIDDFKTGDRTILVEDLEPKEGGIPNFPPQWLFDNVAVGPSGAIYITGGASNSILKIPQNKVP
jgi:sugar lactone lactonase YvrE